MEWKENDFGLLVPASPFSYGAKKPQLNRLRKVLGSKYLLSQQRRQVTAGAQTVPTDLSPWDLQNLRQHVIGRQDESVRVLIGVAFLRKAGLVGRDDPVGYKGAEFQRGKCSKPYPAAHRFPCNPTIRNWGLPHFAESLRLRRALQRPLEKTDYLPNLVNDADRLFEANGACDAVAQAVRFVLHEQPTDKDINPKLIRHGAMGELFPGYKTSLQAALDLAEVNVTGIDVLDPSVFEHVNETWFASAGGSPKAEQSIELVRFTLEYAIQVSTSYGEPITLSPPAIAEYAGRLEALNKEV